MVLQYTVLVQNKMYLPYNQGFYKLNACSLIILTAKKKKVYASVPMQIQFKLQSVIWEKKGPQFVICTP